MCPKHFDDLQSAEKLLRLPTVLDEPVSQLIEQLDEINALTNIGERLRSANHARDIVYTLGQHGGKAEVATPTLIQTMRESGMEFVRIYAARALISIALEEYNELLLETLLQELRPRPSAILSVNSLGQMGHYAKPALEVLRRISDLEYRFMKPSLVITVNVDEALQVEIKQAIRAIEAS